MYSLRCCPWCGKNVNEKTTITKIVELPGFIPNTWRAWTNEGKELYVKHRWGQITVFCINTRCVLFNREVSESVMDYAFDYSNLKGFTNDVFDWPEECEKET